jgi:hypothetical protein
LSPEFSTANAGGKAFYGFSQSIAGGKPQGFLCLLAISNAEIVEVIKVLGRIGRNPANPQSLNQRKSDTLG